MLLEHLLFFALGACIGSFLNVVIDRVPINESLLLRSHCESCGKTLSPIELIPIASYLIQGGKCKHCGAKIPVRLFLVELACGLGYVFLFYYFGYSLDLLRYILLYTFVLTIAVSDLTTMLVPDEIVLCGAIGGLLTAILSRSLIPSLLSSIMLGGVFLLIYLLTKGKGMGQGDVTFAFAIGLYLNPLQSIFVFMLSFIIGAVVGIFLYISTRNHELPFCPYMALSSILVAVFWAQLLQLFSVSYLFL